MDLIKELKNHVVINLNEKYNKNCGIALVFDIDEADNNIIITFHVIHKIIDGYIVSKVKCCKDKKINLMDCLYLRDVNIYWINAKKVNLFHIEATNKLFLSISKQRHPLVMENAYDCRISTNREISGDNKELNIGFVNLDNEVFDILSLFKKEREININW